MQEDLGVKKIFQGKRLLIEYDDAVLLEKGKLLM